MTRHQAPRGNALVVSLIGLAVMLSIVAGAIQMTDQNRRAAAAKMRGDQLVGCADVARKHVLARLRRFGVDPSLIQFGAATTGQTITTPNLLPTSPDPQDMMRLSTGHIGAAASSTGDATVVAVRAAAMGASKDQARDVANTIAEPTLGGRYYRAIVRCTDPLEGFANDPSRAREVEVEFTFRHGI